MRTRYNEQAASLEELELDIMCKDDAALRTRNAWEELEAGLLLSPVSLTSRRPKDMPPRVRFGKHLSSFRRPEKRVEIMRTCNSKWK